MGCPYQRSESRRGYANGFKPKTVNSRLGRLNLKVPQTRDVEFYPSALERGERSERALKLAVAEMYVQGEDRGANQAFAVLSSYGGTHQNLLRQSWEGVLVKTFLVEVMVNNKPSSPKK